MRRDKVFAVHLLNLVVENDSEGAGLTRKEIRSLSEPSRSSYGTDLSSHWNMVDYHLDILGAGGYILRKPDEEGNYEIDDFLMTWAGHDLAES